MTGYDIIAIIGAIITGALLIYSIKVSTYKENSGCEK